MINTAISVLLILASGLLYIRLVPHDMALVEAELPAGAAPGAPVIGANSALFVAEFAAPPEVLLADLANVAAQTPRTRLLSGDAVGPRVTYVTRSLIIGFPDYTTAIVTPTPQGSRLTLFARARFGRSDLGVNAARARAWIGTLEALH